MQGNAMLKPALWGALVIGVLSGLPIVNLANCCCCAWVVAGGMLAAYLLQAGTEAPINLGDGALVGLLAGLFSAVVSTLISVPTRLLLGPIQARLLRQFIESRPDMPENLRQMVDNIGATGTTGAALMIGFVTALFTGAVFAALGGLLGAFFFKKQTTPVPSVQGTV
jgi:hypothetical protein